MNLFELFVKIGVDDQASDKLSGLSSKLGNGLKTAAKIGTAAVGAAATGITALTTAAVNNYAEYEQLVGGVETLFKTSADKVVGYAENAYKTAGLSANEYMETVTSFSASLLQSLDEDTEAATEYANQAITDMADNANKMGTSMEMIQNAYQGFAKQNYSMLDNLKLGYGGTASEMYRLLQRAAELDETFAKTANFSIDSKGHLEAEFADITQAIHIVQTEMGITGTTALEAGRTISGSVGAMKSAWTNLLTGLADGNADVGELINNLVTTIVGDGSEENLGVFGNIMPAVQTALAGASTLISELLPQIVQTIPTIITENLPILAESAISIIQSLADGISQNQEMLMTTAMETITYLATSLISMLPQIVALGLDLIVSLANGIAENLPEIIPTVIEVINQIMTTITENLPLLVSSALEIITSLANGIAESLPEIINVAKGIITTIIDGIVKNTPDLLSNGVKMLADFSANLRKNLGTIFDAGIDTLLKFVDGIVEAMPDLIAYIPEIVSNIANIINDNAPKLLLSAAEIIWKLVTGLINNIPVIIQNLPKIISAIVDTLLAFNWVNLGTNIIKGLGNGLKSMVSFVKDIGNQVVNAIKSGISNLPSKMISIGKNIVSGLWNGIKSMISWLGSQIKSFAGGIVSTAKNALGIRSPSRVFRDQIGKQMAAGLGIGWDEGFDDVKSEIEDSLRFEDASVGINASIRKVGAGAAGMAYGGVSYGDVIINIDGAKYSDEQSLATAVAEALQNMTDRRTAVYA